MLKILVVDDSSTARASIRAALEQDPDHLQARDLRLIALVFHRKYIEAGEEACDDGNLHGGDGCTPSCTAETGTAELEPNRYGSSMSMAVVSSSV